MKSKKLFQVAVVTFAIMVMAINFAHVEARYSRRRGRRYIVEDYVWYDYRDRSIYIDTSGNQKIFLDLYTRRWWQHESVAATIHSGWHRDYGTYTIFGAARITVNEPGGRSILYEWAGRIGELKIDQGEEWHIKAPLCRSEWFGYTLTKKEPPTDWIVVLHASDGNRMLPIKRRFWVSVDEGETWKVFRP